jgi:hypothetical protein
MGGVVVIALLTLLVVWVAPAGARCLRAMRATNARDRPAELLRVAIRGLPADRAEWGRAMLGELDEAPGSRARWRFSLGCAKAATAWRVRERLGGSHRDGAAVRAVILAAVAASLALGAYGPVRYRLPGATWPAVLTLVAVLLAYVLCALGLSRGMAPRAVVARRHGLIGGLAVGAAWLVVLFPTAPLKEWVAAPLLVAMLAPASVAALTARATRDARAATAAALWCGLAGGLVVFVISATAAYLQAGGPFDPQLIRDFQASGAPDLTAYAVSDNLGEALAMLMIVPTVALAAGSLAARLGPRVAQPARD